MKIIDFKTRKVIRVIPDRDISKGADDRAERAPGDDEAGRPAGPVEGGPRAEHAGERCSASRNATIRPPEDGGGPGRPGADKASGGATTGAESFPAVRIQAAVSSSSRPPVSSVPVITFAKGKFTMALETRADERFVVVYNTATRVEIARRRAGSSSRDEWMAWADEVIRRFQEKFRLD